MKIVRARAPLRIGLGGGGTDLEPYCSVYGGSVLNATIDRYAYCILKENENGNLNFIASDLLESQTEKVEKLDEFSERFKFHKAVYGYVMENFNRNQYLPITLQTYSDVPYGSGLGSSSTLVVAIITAFKEYMNLALDDYDIANLAYLIERHVCKLKGGKQDHFAAAFGGVNFIEFFDKNQTIVNPLRIKNWICCELEASLVLYFSGTSRSSSNIISTQISSIENNDEVVISSMHEIKREAIKMKESLLLGNFKEFVKSMGTGWKSKKKSSVSVSSSSLDEIYDIAIEAGAQAGKISGAGGGGFFIFFVPAEKKTNVMKALENLGGSVSNCHLTWEGSQAWHI